MSDPLRGLSAGPGAVLKLHVVAAMRAVQVLPLYRPRAVRTLVAVAREQVEAHRGQRHHYQSDQGLLHEFMLRLGDR